MKRLILATATLALAIPLGACGPEAPPASAGTNAPPPVPTPAPSTTPKSPVANGPIAAIVTRLAALERTYLSVKPYAEMLLPLLPPERAAQIRALQATIEHAFAAARTARSIAEGTAALDRARQAIAQLAR